MIAAPHKDVARERRLFSVVYMLFVLVIVVLVAAFGLVELVSAVHAVARTIGS